MLFFCFDIKTTNNKISLWKSHTYLPQRGCHTIIYSTTTYMCLHFRHMLCSYCIYNSSFIHFRNGVTNFDFYSKLRMHSRCCCAKMNSTKVVPHTPKMSGSETTNDLGNKKERIKISLHRCNIFHYTVIRSPNEFSRNHPHTHHHPVHRLILLYILYLLGYISILRLIHSVCAFMLQKEL